MLFGLWATLLVRQTKMDRRMTIVVRKIIGKLGERRIVYLNWKRSDIEWVRRENKQAANWSVVRSSEESVLGDFFSLLCVRSFVVSDRQKRKCAMAEEEEEEIRPRSWSSVRLKEREIFFQSDGIVLHSCCVYVWMASGRRQAGLKWETERARRKKSTRTPPTAGRPIVIYLSMFSSTTLRTSIVTRARVQLVWMSSKS